MRLCADGFFLDPGWQMAAVPQSLDLVAHSNEVAVAGRGRHDDIFQWTALQGNRGDHKVGFPFWNVFRLVRRDNRPLAKLEETVKIANTRDQGKPKSKATSAIAVTL